MAAGSRVDVESWGKPWVNWLRGVVWMQNGIVLSAKGCNKVSTVFRRRWSYSSNSIEENAYLHICRWAWGWRKGMCCAPQPITQSSSWEEPNLSQAHNASWLAVPLQSCSEGHGPPLCKGFLNWWTHLPPEQKEVLQQTGTHCLIWASQCPTRSVPAT